MSFDDVLNILDRKRKPILQDYGFQTPLILYYHSVSNEHLPHISNLYKYKDVDFFLKDLDYLQKHYNIISPQELISCNKIEENSVMLSFDDGFKECHDIIAPILIERGIPAAFFINPNFLDNKGMYYRNKLSVLIDALETNEYSQTQLECCNAIFPDCVVSGKELKEAMLTVKYTDRECVDRALDILGVSIETYLKEKTPYMTTEQVEFLRDNGFYIGGHSFDHSPLNKLTFQEQIEQMLGSTDFIQNKFNLPYRIASIPHTDRGLEGQFYHAMRDSLDVLFGGHGLMHMQNYNYYRRVNPEHSKNIRFFLEKQFGIRLVKKYM